VSNISTLNRILAVVPFSPGLVSSGIIVYDEVSILGFEDADMKYSSAKTGPKSVTAAKETKHHPSGLKSAISLATISTDSPTSYTNLSVSKYWKSK